MANQLLYNVCPICNKAPVIAQDKVFRCNNCSLTVKERSVLGLFNKGQYGIVRLGRDNCTLAQQSLKDIVLPPDPLRVVLGNIYSDDELAKIAAGDFDVIAPVQTVLAQIILEQLNEVCYINVNGLRRGHGKILAEQSNYWPEQLVSEKGMQWQDEGNLFCTTNRLVLPSNQFTFIRLDRKVVAIQAFLNGIAIQRKNETYATYFVDCYPHEAALVAAYVMAKVPFLRPEKMA